MITLGQVMHPIRECEHRNIDNIISLIIQASKYIVLYFDIDNGDF